MWWYLSSGNNLARSYGSFSLARLQMQYEFCPTLWVVWHPVSPWLSRSDRSFLGDTLFSGIQLFSSKHGRKKKRNSSWCSSTREKPWNKGNNVHTPNGISALEFSSKPCFLLFVPFLRGTDKFESVVRVQLSDSVLTAVGTSLGGTMQWICIWNLSFPLILLILVKCLKVTTFQVSLLFLHAASVCSDCSFQGWIGGQPPVTVFLNGVTAVVQLKWKKLALLDLVFEWLNTVPAQ